MADLRKALRNAHNQGDEDAARRIAAMIKKQSASPQALNQQQVKTQQTQQDFTETPSFLDDLGRHAGAVGENILAFGSSAVAEPVAGLAGIVQSINPFAEEGAGAEAVEGVRESLTYQPKTELGQQKQQAVGEVLRPIGEAIEGTGDYLADNIFELTGSPTLAAAAKTLPTAVLEGIGLKGISKVRGKSKITGISDESISRLKDQGIDIDDLSNSGVKKIKDAQKAQFEVRLKEFEDAGVTPTAGDIMEGPKRFDQQVSEAQLLADTGDASQSMRQARLEQSRGLRSNLESMVDDIGVPEELGQSVKDALEGRKGELESIRRQAYDTLSSTTKDVNVPLSTVGIKKSFPDAGEIRDLQGLVPAQANTLNNLLEEFGVVGRNPITPLSVSNFEQFRKRLGAIERSDQTGQIARATGPIKRALDREVDLASKSLELEGAPDVSSAAKEARKSHVALRTEFDDKALTSKLIDTKRKSSVANIENSQVYQKLSSRSTPTEQFSSVIDSLKNSGTKGRKAISDIKNRMITDIIDSSFSSKGNKIGGERVFSGVQFQKAFDLLRPKLEKIMSPAEMKRLNNTYNVAEKLIPPTGVARAGSTAIQRLFDRIGISSVAGAVPGGHLIINQIEELSKKARNKKALDRALEKPKYKNTIKVIKDDYPSLAAALGIGQIKTEEDE